MLLNQRFQNLAEHDAGHHSHRGWTDTETLAGFHLVVIFHRFQSDLFQPFPTLILQLGQNHLTGQQRQKMSNLNDAVALTFVHYIHVVRKWSEGIIGCFCHDDTALETIRIIAYHSIERIRRSAHHHVP